MWVGGGGRVGIMAGQLVVGSSVMFGWVVVVLGVVVMLASGLLSPPEVSLQLQPGPPPRPPLSPPTASARPHRRCNEWDRE